MNCIRYMCPVLHLLRSTFFFFFFHGLHCQDLEGYQHLFATSLCAQNGKRNTQKHPPNMVRGDPRYTKRSRHCLLYILAPFLAFSLDCCSILLLCAVTGHASLNIISDRHDHHHHQLSLSIYQHSRVPGEWVYCFCCLLIITCIPRLFYVMCVCVLVLL
ncbi:hypothetical protein BO82DRAFT_107478 [Aspergillus uvarum CBS 121591]|uniref:Uncharacterized protein n=1 Tax=Aspergillus uvarum CBS 121591 TaxID=1448315 RepID=A0A319DM16_9EURO|nr:hypothetical protein BO82DRAFT_107478 [Aspergillus uvarum CBS 121591]PYH80462.1 hypothetical protein BO82DRAFT_107478 [Aspergillus uvarum CBS 121591]